LVSCSAVSSGEYVESDNLDKVTVETLEQICNDCLNYDTVNDDLSVKDKTLTSYVINNISRDESGRISVPALWDESVKHRLPNNYKLANSILSNIQRKLSSQPDKLEMYDGVIKQQVTDGVLEVIDDLAAVKNSDSVSFIAHNAVFKDNNDTTKCRVVLLSNLCEKGEGNLSHNQVSVPGPDLNSKLFVTCTLYRFNKYLLIYDLEKAFLQLGLNPEDCDKLHILWFRDVAKKDFRRVAMKFRRVPFGLRFSPALLMIVIYVILILDCSDDRFDNSVREMLYNLTYMDNIAYSTSSDRLLYEAYLKSHSIFNSYCFNLQKFATNCKTFEANLTQESENTDETKLFGMIWNTADDSFRNRPPFLDPKAKTKREILSTLNSNYDPLGILLPMFNRAKLFVRDLQSDSNLQWDTNLSPTQLKTWHNICKQCNRGSNWSLPRYIGDYDSEYDVICFTDASKDFYGCVLYLRENSTDNLSFALAKNRTISKTMTGKTIPVLELNAIDFGVSCAIEFYSELTKAFRPVKVSNIHVYTDSSIALSWFSARSLKIGKIERKGSKINNCLDRIVENCNIKPVHFHHIVGIDNPADKVSRCYSSTMLGRSNYHSGPIFPIVPTEFDVTVPTNDLPPTEECISFSTAIDPPEPIVPLDKYSSFYKFCRVVHIVRKFVYLLKLKVTTTKSLSAPDSCKYGDSIGHVIKDSQADSFPDILSYLRSPARRKCPTLVSQLNLFLDDNGIIRVKNKFKNLDAPFAVKYPVLLDKSSPMTRCIITDFHVKYKHAGVYKLLSLLRREFHITNAFMTVKKLLKDCVVCRKLHGRPTQLNQNDYREVRINPSRVPYRNIAIDHAGPFKSRSEGVTVKCYVLIVTCMFSRAVNLLMCRRIDKESFLLALQEHVFEYGIPEDILSDNGSPIVSSVSIIHSYLRNDVDVKNYLTERNIKLISFSPYPPGASFLGGTVEALVKQAKNMINATLSKNVVPIEHFNYLVKECQMLINKRPVALKSSIRNSDVDCDAHAMTPEMIVKGYEVPNLLIIPHLNSDMAPGENYCPNTAVSERELFDSFSSLRKVRDNLHERYYDEFLDELRKAASDEDRRYKLCAHTPLRVGDYVAVKQNHTKPYFRPTGIVTQTEKNSLGEVVSVVLRKSNGEHIRRHCSDVILLLPAATEDTAQEETKDPDSVPEDDAVRKLPARKAAVECRNRNRMLLTNS